MACSAPKCRSGIIQYNGTSTSLQVPMLPRRALSSSACLRFLSCSSSIGRRVVVACSGGGLGGSGPM
eukprot:10024545-Lingulodinium_polyedra.AAC.1